MRLNFGPYGKFVDRRRRSGTDLRHPVLRREPLRRSGDRGRLRARGLRGAQRELPKSPGPPAEPPTGM